MIASSVTLLDTASIIGLLMVALIGLPHGAFDAAVGNYLGAYRSRWSLVRFVLVYSLIVAFVVLVWMAVPGLSLAIFLIISMVHFGWGDANAKTTPVFILQIAMHGGLAVFGIVNFHLAEAAAVFDVLTGGDTAIALAVARLASFALPVLGTIYALLAFWHPEIRVRVIELIAIGLLLFMLPPLVGFACYFCFVHTGRHMRHIWQKLQTIMSVRHIVIQATGFTLASWFFGGAALLWLNSGHLDAAILQVVFIGLAALTVPHMILIDGFFRIKGRKRVL